MSLQVGCLGGTRFIHRYRPLVMKSVYISYNQGYGSQRQTDYRDNISRDNVHPLEFILFMIHEHFVSHSRKTARRCEEASK
jgi:hypothetical protein